jgi:hypothetical protein
MHNKKRKPLLFSFLANFTLAVVVFAIMFFSLYIYSRWDSRHDGTAIAMDCVNIMHSKIVLPLICDENDQAHFSPLQNIKKSFHDVTEHKNETNGNYCTLLTSTHLQYAYYVEASFFNERLDKYAVIAFCPIKNRDYIIVYCSKNPLKYYIDNNFWFREPLLPVKNLSLDKIHNITEHSPIFAEFTIGGDFIFRNVKIECNSCPRKRKDCPCPIAPRKSVEKEVNDVKSDH